MKRLSAVCPVLGRLTPIDWACLNFNVAVGLIWAVTTLAAPPPLLHRMAGSAFFWVWMMSAVFGAIAACIGLVISAGTDPERRRKGMRLEMSGLYLLLAGPAVFFAIDLGLLFTSFSVRLAAYTALSYALCAAIVVRVVMVRWLASHQKIVIEEL